MDIDTRKPSLPAPTESWVDSNSTVYPTDLATDISRRTDRTSYSIPEDGSPLVVSKRKLQLDKSGGAGAHSQTSLLIEYYEGGKPGDAPHSRPSLRLRVTPSSKKSKTSDSVRITKEIGEDRKPSYTKRISLVDRQTPQHRAGRNISNLSDSTSGHPPLEVEILKGSSDLSSSDVSHSRILPMASDISSMPADSMLDGPVAFKSPERRSSRGMEREKIDDSGMHTLKAPPRRRSRSLSRERITQKVMEKLTSERHAQEASGKRGKQKSSSSSRDLSDEELKPRSRGSNRHHRESDLRSGTPSSITRARDLESNVSGASKSSVNNPKVLQAVEDAIRRLILPEIESIKRQQSSRYEHSARGSFASESSPSRTDTGHRLSKSTNETRERPKVVLNRDDTDLLSGESPKEKKNRRTSRDSGSEPSSVVRSASRERERQHRRERRRQRDADVEESAASGLTATALKSHDSRERARERMDSRERRKRHSKVDSRTDSIAVTDEEYYDRSKIPPLPMTSELVDSDLTRDSILSAESAESDRPISGYSEGLKSPIRSVSRGVPRTMLSPESRSINRTPVLTSPPTSRRTNKTITGLDRIKPPDGNVRSPEARSLKSNRSSDKSIRTKAMTAGLVAAGLGSAATSGMYSTDRHRNTEERSPLTERPRHKSRASSVRSDASLRRSLELTGAATAASSTADLPQGLGDQYETDTRYHAREPDMLLESVDDGYFSHQPKDDSAGFPSGRSEGRRVVGLGPSNDQFFHQQHQLNDEYRQSLYDSDPDPDQDSRQHSEQQQTQADYDETFPSQKLLDLQTHDLQDTPQGGGGPVHVESAVASLVDPSMLESERSVQAATQRFSYQSSTDSGGEAARSLQGSPAKFNQPTLQTQHDNSSWDRWAQLKETAKARSNDSRDQLTSQSPLREQTSSPRLTQGLSGALPIRDVERKQSTRDLDSVSNSTGEASNERYGSIPKEGGLLGYGNVSNERWPEEIDQSKNKRDGFISSSVLPGAVENDQAAQVGSSREDFEEKWKGRSLDAGEISSSEEGYFQANIRREPPHEADLYQSKDGATPTQARAKDEGYVLTAQRRSSDALTPLSFSNPPPRLFEEVDLTKDAIRSPQEDPFVARKREGYQNDDAQEYDSPTFEAATGTGLNKIQSKDVVALMDHLTVRDGHRNARDTEILVTLVRSAAEMRTSIDEMKRFIENQSRLNMQKADQVADRTINKILSGPRPVVPAAPRVPARSASAETDDMRTKKQNIFKRALKGLSSKSTADLAKIEDMLNQLLDEVEGLRDAQIGGVQASASARGNSLDSYERLRVAADTGYLSQAQSGAPLGSPNRLRDVPTGPQTAQTSYGYSGYEVPRNNENKRISTVMEDDEEDGANDDGMRTPTQENQRSRQYHSTEQQSRSMNYQSNDTNTEAADKNRKQKSNGPLWGIPGLSRWSKTTASSAPDNRSSVDAAAQGRRDVPYSDGSRSGSDVNVLPGNHGLYTRVEEDRFQSPISSSRMPRSPSPLIPDSSSASEDAKYKANRHSLDLQHPQPRQGSTRRHQTHLESQATVYPDAPPLSPDSDAFGSNPSLARFHGGVMAANRPSSQYYGTNTASSPNSIPANHSAKETSSPIVPKAQPTLTSANMLRVPQFDDGPLVPQTGGTASSNDEYDDEDDWDAMAAPLSRKRSPYSPGGLLAPIEERYSMEGDRSSLGYRDSLRSNRSARAQRHSMHGMSEGAIPDGKGMADVREEDEDAPYGIDRSGTPKMEPRAAVGAGGEQVRKLTGPREMPRTVSGGGGGGAVLAGGDESEIPAANALKGTVRRKPARRST